MKALTLTQPFASLIAIGAKCIETRDWRTSYRGPLAIHAAKKTFDGYEDFVSEEPFFTPLYEAGYCHWTRADLPLGAIVAVATLDGCYRTEDLRGDRPDLVPLHPQERAFGNYDDGRFGWYLRDVRRLPKPVPCRGYPSLWDVPVDVAEQIERQLARLEARR